MSYEKIVSLAGKKIPHSVLTSGVVDEKPPLVSKESLQEQEQSVVTPSITPPVQTPQKVVVEQPHEVQESQVKNTFEPNVAPASAPKQSVATRLAQSKQQSENGPSVMQKIVPMLLVVGAFIIPLLLLFVSQATSSKTGSSPIPAAAPDASSAVMVGVLGTQSQTATSTSPIVLLIASLAIVSVLLFLLGLLWMSSQDKRYKDRGKMFVLFGFFGIVCAAFFYVMTAVTYTNQKKEVKPQTTMTGVTLGYLASLNQWVGPVVVYFSSEKAVTPSQKVQKVEWDFGDGKKATGFQTQHEYTQVGSFTVVLTVTDMSGKQQQYRDMVVITNITPTVRGIVSKTGGIAPLTVQFDASGSKDPNGSVVGYHWDFGDGRGSGSFAKMDYTYTTPGEYVVRLDVTDDNGDATTQTSAIIVSAEGAPAAIFTADTFRGPAPLRVSFDASGSKDPDAGDRIVSYLWDFGDKKAQNTSGVQAQYVFAQPWVYQVRLQVTDSTGQKGVYTHEVVATDSTFQPTARIVTKNMSPTREMTAPVTYEFDGSQSSMKYGTLVDYIWDFGDGTKKEHGQKLTHTFSQAGNYTVQLTVIDDQGQQAIQETTLKIGQAKNQAPVASFRYTPDAAAFVPETELVFDGTSSKDADGQIVKYVWEFGPDVPKIEGSKVSYTFHSPGVYPVKLHVFDNEYQESVVEKLIIIQSEAMNPVVSLSQTHGFAPFEVSANAVKSTGDIRTFFWDFGDGYTVDNEVEPKPHIYTQPGVYTLTLRVTDVAGQTAEVSQQIFVSKK